LDERAVIVYVILCVVVPLAWGLVVVFVSNRIERAVKRRRAKDGDDERELPPTEYHI
jgi:hypothetical protein